MDRYKLRVKITHLAVYYKPFLGWGFYMLKSMGFQTGVKITMFDFNFPFVAKLGTWGKTQVPFGN
jgi:hypothetical protein